MDIDKATVRLRCAFDQGTARISYAGTRKRRIGAYHGFVDEDVFVYWRAPGAVAFGVTNSRVCSIISKICTTRCINPRWALVEPDSCRFPRPHWACKEHNQNLPQPADLCRTLGRKSIARRCEISPLQMNFLFWRRRHTICDKNHVKNHDTTKNRDARWWFARRRRDKKNHKYKESSSSIKTTAGNVQLYCGLCGKNVLCESKRTMVGRWSLTTVVSLSMRNGRSLNEVTK